MFHVPETARLTAHPILASSVTDGNNGMFLLESPEPGWRLACLASDGLGWEHVSVHAFRGDLPAAKQRTPTWPEMAYVKRMFWGGDDVVVQFHPRERDYINMHPHTLHLWRPIGVELPTPDPILVGV